VKHHLQRYLLDVFFLTANFSGRNIDICVGVLLQGFFACSMKLKKRHYFEPVA
jgi:hypothetical protein